MKLKALKWMSKISNKTFSFLLITVLWLDYCYFMVVLLLLLCTTTAVVNVHNWLRMSLYLKTKLFPSWNCLLLTSADNFLQCIDVDNWIQGMKSTREEYPSCQCEVPGSWEFNSFWAYLNITKFNVTVVIRQTIG